MAKVSIYLNFAGNTEDAFNFYKSVFKTEFDTPIYRMKEVPMPPGAPALPEKEQQAVMHMSLPILSGIVLQGNRPMLESMGHKLKVGNNTTIWPGARQQGRDRIAFSMPSPPAVPTSIR